MALHRLIDRSRRQRRWVGALLARHSLLRRTDVGAHLLHVLGQPDAASVVPGYTPDAWDAPGMFMPASEPLVADVPGEVFDPALAALEEQPIGPVTTPPDADLATAPPRPPLAPPAATPPDADLATAPPRPPLAPPAATPAVGARPPAPIDQQIAPGTTPPATALDPSAATTPPMTASANRPDASGGAGIQTPADSARPDERITLPSEAAAPPTATAGLSASAAPPAVPPLAAGHPIAEGPGASGRPAAAGPVDEHVRVSDSRGALTAPPTAYAAEPGNAPPARPLSAADTPATNSPASAPTSPAAPPAPRRNRPRPSVDYVDTASLIEREDGPPVAELSAPRTPATWRADHAADATSAAVPRPDAAQRDEAGADVEQSQSAAPRDDAPRSALAAIVAQAIALVRQELPEPTFAPLEPVAPTADRPPAYAAAPADAGATPALSADDALRAGSARFVPATAEQAPYTGSPDAASARTPPIARAASAPEAPRPPAQAAHTAPAAAAAQRARADSMPEDTPSAPPPIEQATSSPRAAQIEAGAGAAASSAPARPEQGQPRQAPHRRGRLIEEIGIRRSPPPEAKPAQSAAEQRFTAADIFNQPSAGPERSGQEWARLLFEATRAPQTLAAPQADDAAAPAPAAAAQPTIAPPRPAGAATPTARATPATPPVLQARYVAGTPAAPAVLTSPPTLLSEPARRFLRPLIGIDPASARVHRGPQAGEIAAGLAADALAAGDDVVLAAGHADESSPATLGVLAHELTHVARARAPRFVPPIVRDTIGDTSGEEPIAQAVEARTVRAAHTAQSRPILPSAASPHAAPSPTHAARSADAAADWGGLPAPWEPLPSWATTAWNREAPPVQPFPGAPAAPPAGAGAPGNGAAPPIALAAINRTEAPGAPAAAQTQPAEPQQEPAPDLDALARQVYAVLKQRLAAERRRLG